MKTFENRIAVITGAASGIGQAVAEAFATEGCDVAIADMNETGLAETATRVERRGRRATRHVVDVSKRSEMDRFVGEVESEHGGANIIVNNAGVSVAKTFEQHSLEDFEWLFGVNFWGVVYGCKLFLPLLRQAEEAHIVNISSIFGIIGVPMNSSYCASKFAVRGLSESLRVELADSGIGVTSVHPGGIATNIVASARWSEDEGAQKTQNETVASFKSMMPPSEAARRIVDGVANDKQRVLITKEAHLGDALQRISPRAVSRLVAGRWRKMGADGVTKL